MKYALGMFPPRPSTGYLQTWLRNEITLRFTLRLSEEGNLEICLETNEKKEESW